MSEHTPTPWKLGGRVRVVGPHPKGDLRLRHIATAIHDTGTYREEQEANARHIVHCVNNHERLVEALLFCVEQIENEDPDQDCLDNLAADKARALLAELEAKP